VLYDARETLLLLFVFLQTTLGVVDNHKHLQNGPIVDPRASGGHGTNPVASMEALVSLPGGGARCVSCLWKFAETWNIHIHIHIHIHGRTRQTRFAALVPT
jgi:hypothetical protein